LLIEGKQKTLPRFDVAHDIAAQFSLAKNAKTSDKKKKPAPAGSVRS
jgi:hypothetical protein